MSARLRVVAAVEAGVEHETVAHRVVEIARVAVLQHVRDGYLALERVHDADLARQVHRLVEMERPCVRHHEVVLDLDGAAELERMMRREIARDVAVLRDGPRLVERRPFLHAVTERLEADARVIHEMVDERAALPAARMKIHERRIEMMQRHERLDAVRDAGIDELVIVVNTLLVHTSFALGQDARP